MNNIKNFYSFVLSIMLSACVSTKTSLIESSNYDAGKNETIYTVLPLGTVAIPGKWEKEKYNNISHQQFFVNHDSVTIAIAFNRYNNYEFNANGAQKGNDFIKAFYEWDSQYFVSKYGYKRMLIEESKSGNYLIYRIFDDKGTSGVDTYFLIGERSGNSNSFSINSTKKWSENQKIDFLKKMYNAIPR